MKNNMGDKKQQPQPTPQLKLKGLAASPGIAIGPAFLYFTPTWEPQIEVIHPERIDKEIKLLRRAIGFARDYVERSIKKAQKQYGDDIVHILEVQLAFLNDEIFIQEIEEYIRREKVSAAYAAYVLFNQLRQRLQSSPDDYMQQRASDLLNLKWLIIEHIRGGKRQLKLKEPSIIIADDLSPADTVHLHREKVLGIATNKGGINSHTVIIARALSVPAVVGLESITSLVNEGDTLILDGSEGEVIIAPDEETIVRYQKQQAAFIEHEEILLQKSKGECSTKDEKRIEVLANIEFGNEIDQVKRVGADGIGLFRTEGIYINRNILPSEREQTKIYRTIAEAMAPAPVVIRTLDVGGDKIFPNIFPVQEPNPFLGYRAVRFCLDHRDCFGAQLRAIIRANTKGNIRIMLPMISGLEEVRAVKEIYEEVYNELKRRGKVPPKPPLGIMVEIPSVAIMAEEFAREVDFFSIGTNDLVQYTLAVDRSNERVAHLYSHFHPAVLRLIDQTVQAAKRVGIPVSMCGEMAGDPLAIPVLLGMGLESLSASHILIPEMKVVIHELRIDECQKVWEEVRKFKTGTEVRDYLRNFYLRRFNHILSVQSNVINDVKN